MTELISTVLVAALAFGGALSLLVGLCLLFGTLRFLGRAVRLPGRVVGYEASPGGMPDGPCASYHPTVEFEYGSGHPHRVTLSFGFSSRTHAVGAPVVVLFDPADPARLRSFLHLWSFPLVFTALGALSLTGAVGFGVMFDVL